MKKPLHLLRLVALALFLGAVSQVQAQPNLDFELVNKTGFDIKGVFISPNDKDDWEENILTRVLSSGETLEVSFGSGQRTTKWDIMVIWTDDDSAYWRGYDLSRISRLTLFYDVSTGEATAVEE